MGRGWGNGLHHRGVVVGVVGAEFVQPAEQSIRINPGGFGALRAEIVDNRGNPRINPQRLLLRVGEAIEIRLGLLHRDGFVPGDCPGEEPAMPASPTGAGLVPRGPGAPPRR